MGTFASVCPGGNVDSGTVAIVPVHFGEKRTASENEGSAYLAASGSGIINGFARFLLAAFIVRHSSIPHQSSAVSSMNPVNPVASSSASRQSRQMGALPPLQRGL
jgi:hypothetical protein